RNTRAAYLTRATATTIYTRSLHDALPIFLNESLASVAECSWIKIVPYPQDFNFQAQIEQMGSFTQLQIPLFKQQERIGSLFFMRDRKSTRLNSSHVKISYAVFCLKKKRLL